MSNLLKQTLLQCRSPLSQSQRYRGKINIQRPRKPHYERAKLIEATKPPLRKEPVVNTCFTSYKERHGVTMESPYNAIIAREVRNWLEHSRTVGIFHMNSITADDLFPVRVKLHKQNLHLKSYGQKIIRQAVDNSRFEAILPLFCSSQCLVFSPEQKVAQMLRITRKVPQLILIAGIVEDRLLSRNEMLNYVKLPNLQTLQAGLVNTLNMAAGNLVRQLETHQNNFVHILDVYAKSLDTSKEENKLGEVEKQDSDNSIKVS